MFKINNLRSLNCDLIAAHRYYTSYVQGQKPSKNIREYFYYIDHQGMLFLDDARIKNFTSCFKDKVFLEFFFKRLGRNQSDRYPEFPYVSNCGRERNYVRCDDVPIVFTEVLNTEHPSEDLFGYAHAGRLLTVKFQPEKIYMSMETGRVYHPANEKHGRVGLVRSNLAIEFSKLFKFNNGESQSPTHFTWSGKTYELDQEWFRSSCGKN